MHHSRLSLVAFVAAAALVASDTSDALSDGPGRTGRRNRRNIETVRMARPADGGDPNARGNITIVHRRRGDDAVLRVRGLDRRDTYDVVDGQTGDRLGTLRTNRLGRGTFDLVPPVAARALRSGRADGSDARDVPEIVTIVDPDTGDPVLTGDTTGDLMPLFGFATVGNATESATITMGADPVTDTHFISFIYFAAPSDDSRFAGVHVFHADTSEGGTLPLGKTSVLDLSGLRFEVRNVEGETVFRGTLPDVEAPAIPDPDEPTPLPEDPGAGAVPFDFGSWFQGGDRFSSFAMSTFFGGGSRHYKTGRFGVLVEEPVVEFTLWLESGEGFEMAGDLVAPQFGPSCGDFDLDEFFGRDDFDLDDFFDQVGFDFGGLFGREDDDGDDDWHHDWDDDDDDD